MGTKKNDKPAGGKTKPAKAENESKQPWWKQPWWFNLPDPIERFTGWLVICTAVLCVATIGLAVVAYKTDQTLKDTLLISQRAWIAPYDVKIEGEFMSGAKGRFVVDYRNVGGQPATNVKHVGGFAILAEGEQFAWPDYCKLATENVDLVVTAYPSESVHYTMGINFENVGTVYEALSGEKILYLRGCLVYETFEKLRQSQFCFRWVKDPLKDKLRDWNHQFCPSGNDGN